MASGCNPTDPANMDQICTENVQETYFQFYVGLGHRYDLIVGRNCPTMVYRDWNIHTISFLGHTVTYGKHILDTRQWTVHILDMFQFCHAPNHPFCLVKHLPCPWSSARAPALQLRPMVLCQAPSMSMPLASRPGFDPYPAARDTYWPTKENSKIYLLPHQGG